MPVVLLHQSPYSSAEFIPLIRELAEDYLVIAPDTPGNGLSDPLPGPLEQSEIREYADALAEFLDVLGFGQVALYGFHTGALSALEFARRYPARVITAVVNGFVALPEALCKDIIRDFFATVEPDWTGAHLHWWWMRLREQYHFFPWFRKEAACRTAFDMPDALHLHEVMMEVMRAGNGYRRPYRAAFSYDALTAVKEVAAPAVVMTDKTDLLYPCLDLIEDAAPGVRIERPDDPEAARRLLKEALADCRGPAASVDPQPAAPKPGAIWRDYVQTSAGSMLVRRNHDGDGRPVLLIPDALRSGASVTPVMQALLGRRPVLAFDLAGTGESDGWAGEGDAIDLQAALVGEALAVLGVDAVDVVAFGRGENVARRLKAQAPGLVTRLLVDPAPVAGDPKAPAAPLDRWAPEIAIDPLGAHFTFVWNMVRDHELYAPWFRREAAHAIHDREPEVDAETIHHRTIDLFLCLPNYREIVRAHLAHEDSGPASGEAAGITRAAGEPDTVAEQVIAWLEENNN